MPDANTVLAELNALLAAAGMPPAAFTVEPGTGALGWPMLRVRLVQASDPGLVYGEMCIPRALDGDSDG